MKNKLPLLFTLLITIVLFQSCKHKTKPETFLNDCEPDGMWSNSATLKQKEEAHSGKMVSVLDSTHEYSLTLNKPLNELINGMPKKITISAWIRYANMNAKSQIVLSVEDNGKSVDWQGFNNNKTITAANKWFFIKESVTLQKAVKPEHVLKFYVWNNSKEEIWVDDLKVETN